MRLGVLVEKLAAVGLRVLERDRKPETCSTGAFLRPAPAREPLEELGTNSGALRPLSSTLSRK